MERQPQSSVEVITATGQAIVLNWFNTKLKTYREAVYNHVEWTTPEGTLMAYAAPLDVLDTLFENDFPNDFRPEVPEFTKRWYEHLAVSGLAQELAMFARGEL